MKIGKKGVETYIIYLQYKQIRYIQITTIFSFKYSSSKELQYFLMI